MSAPRETRAMTDGASGQGEQVFLVPVDPETFDRTMAEPVDLTDLGDRPEALSGLETARLWGVANGSRTVETFDRMEPGDLLLFYDDGTYVGVGRVGHTLEDEAGWLSATLWDGEPATHVLTVSDFQSVSIPLAAVNTLFDYGAGYVPGFTRVAPDRVTASLPAIERAVMTYDDQRA